MLVAAGIVKSMTFSFLRSGHSHEDIDQVFGELAKHIMKYLRIAQTLEDIESCLREFLADRKYRPYENGRFASRLDHIRDWKAWLYQVHIKLAGIGGPSAAHWFEFVRREGSSCLALILA